VACRALAAALGTELGWVVAVLQTILLAGVTTVLVHDLGWRLTTRPGIGAWRRFSSRSTLTCNSTAPTVLPEALTVTLTVAMVSLRLRDGTSRRAAWLLAALGLVRPNFVVFPLAFAGLDALRLRRVRAVLAPLLPTAVVLAAWSAVALTSGADPARPLRWFVPMHTFGTYDVGRLAIAFHPFDAMCGHARAARSHTGSSRVAAPKHRRLTRRQVTQGRRRV